MSPDPRTTGTTTLLSYGLSTVPRSAQASENLINQVYGYIAPDVVLFKGLIFPMAVDQFSPKGGAWVTPAPST